MRNPFGFSYQIDYKKRSSPHIDIAPLDYLAEQHIGIESNLSSNVQTSTVPSDSAHPPKTFLEHGTPATINTNDPVISVIDISYEYQMAVKEVGLYVEQGRQAQRNALQMCFLREEEKQVLVDDKR